MAEGARGEEAGRPVSLLGARLSCSAGLLLGIAQFLAALFGGGANTSAGVLGVGLGVLGYFLGARWLALATVFLCAATILFGLAASQGLIPGIPPSDQAFPTI